MYPQAFLKTFWRMELLPQIFVAMSFAERYHERFNKIIDPAIRAISINGKNLKSYRVDLSKSGDSILTEITDGIAHSQMFLADVSSVGKDVVSGKPFRNGNVMYEVGIALACRHPSDILLVRDDQDPFLFDITDVPHKTIDFTDKHSAREELKNILVTRLNEQKHVNDARIKLAIDTLTSVESQYLKYLARFPPNTVTALSGPIIHKIHTIQRLLDKQLIRVVGEFENGEPAYILTLFGRIVANLVRDHLRKFKINTGKKEKENTPDSYK